MRSLSYITVAIMSAALTFTVIELSSPMPDVSTVDLHESTVVGMVEYSPGVCRYEELTYDGSILPIITLCPPPEYQE